MNSSRQIIEINVNFGPEVLTHHHNWPMFIFLYGVCMEKLIVTARDANEVWGYVVPQAVNLSQFIWNINSNRLIRLDNLVKSQVLVCSS